MKTHTDQTQLLEATVLGELVQHCDFRSPVGIHYLSCGLQEDLVTNKTRRRCSGRESPPIEQGSNDCLPPSGNSLSLLEEDKALGQETWTSWRKHFQLGNPGREKLSAPIIGIIIILDCLRSGFLLKLWKKGNYHVLNTYESQNSFICLN